MIFFRNHEDATIYRSSYTRKYGSLHAYSQILQCVRESSNRFDPFVVSIVNDGEIVGQTLRTILAACALFKQHHESIWCEVKGDS